MTTISYKHEYFAGINNSFIVKRQNVLNLTGHMYNSEKVLIEEKKKKMSFERGEELEFASKNEPVKCLVVSRGSTGL